MYKVFNQQKLILFTEKFTISEQCADMRIVKVLGDDDLYQHYADFINDPSLLQLVFVCVESVNSCFETFTKTFTYVNAAGGLIHNQFDQLLMIKRFGKWDLPKGKVEKGEYIEEAAIRECEEETGISGLSLIKKLNPSFHIYEVKGKPYLKETHWFEMKTTSNKDLVPQEEEDIIEAKWMNKNEVFEALKNTYASLKGLIEENYLQI